jgi:ELL-associated factor.
MAFLIMLVMKKSFTGCSASTSIFLNSGHVKPSNRKDCILIIDQETGEVTLERLSGHIMVKKTRPERPDKGDKPDEFPVEKLDKPEKAAKSSYIGNGASSRPLTPIEPFQKSNKASSPGIII